MKALSFRQPWAELILQGRKTMDLRTYSTPYRGRIAVHAPQTIEAAACQAYGLNPASLDAGGIVGTVELVDVIPLDEAAYQQRLDAHLSGRHWREGLYGWVLADPQRLPAFLPTPGRRNFFHVDLPHEPANQTPAKPTLSRPQAADAVPVSTPRRRTAYEADLNGATPQKPFALHVQPVTGAATDYTLTLRQRVVERPKAGQPEATSRLETVVVIGGDNLRAVADHVIEALRKAEYKATDLSAARRKPFYLPEEVGVRLGLVLLTVKPLHKLRRVEQISYGIRQMPSEEAYYWYSKCTAAGTADRAQKALRALLAAE